MDPERFWRKRTQPKAATSQPSPAGPIWPMLIGLLRVRVQVGIRGRALGRIQEKQFADLHETN